MPQQRPLPGEYAPHQEKYVALVSSPVLAALREQRGEVERVLLAIPEEDAGRRYQPGKWSIRQMVGHLSDAERVYGFRALSLARGHSGELPGYDPDGYVAAANFDERTMRSLVEELIALRDSTSRFFENLPAEAWSRAGVLNGKPLSVRALAYIAAGHVTQHLNVLQERYGVPRMHG
jgi:DinB superfamily